MQPRKGVFIALIVSLLLMVGSAVASECHVGIGGYDECGNWHCYYNNAGDCLLCWDEIVVKG